jgi:hypothetical protein
MKLYTTPPSILTLVTWVPQNRQGKLHLSLRGAPHPLRSAGKHSTKVNQALQGLFLLLTRGADNSRPNYTAPSCPTERLS